MVMPTGRDDDLKKNRNLPMNLRVAVVKNRHSYSR